MDTLQSLSVKELKKRAGLEKGESRLGKEKEAFRKK